MKSYKQINVKLANGLYRRPVKQYCSDSSMTNKVLDTNLILLEFLNLKSRESFTDNILTHETIDPYLKSEHFQFVKFILIGHFFVCYLQMNTL